MELNYVVCSFSKQNRNKRLTIEIVVVIILFLFVVYINTRMRKAKFYYFICIQIALCSMCEAINCSVKWMKSMHKMYLHCCVFSINSLSEFRSHME